MTPEVMRFFANREDKCVGRVLEVGSYDVNGTISDLVNVEIKTDMRPGPNVDFVCPAEDLSKHFPAECFDAVVSAETFEHVENWRGALQSMWDVLREDGWLIVTMASRQKGRHMHPNDYWRMEEEHLKQIWPDATLHKLGGTSVGWEVQKKGPLPDLSKINLIPV